MQLFNLGLSFSGFSIPIFTELCILIDAAIYGIATAAVEGFYQVVELSYSVFSPTTADGAKSVIYAILQRIMVLAGIYALFRLSIMLINYLVNPSKLKEAENTGVTIVKNAFIAIILLLTMNFIFGKLGDFQKFVFESNVIENIIYGTDADESTNSIKQSAKKFTNNMWLLFFTPKEDVPATGTCVTSYNEVVEGTGNILSLIGCHYKYYDYLPLAPFIVGIFLVYYFVMYCMELAARMLKLLVLQVLAPIPIIMSIDPSQKNRLSNYIKVYLPIYIQIFIRVFTFYTAFAISSIVIDEAGNLFGGLDKIGWFLKIIIILGIFQGAKEIPKLIENALGFKVGAGTEKTFGGYVRGLLGGTAGLAVGAVGGTVAGAISGGVGGAAAGLLSGAGRGIVGGVTSKNWGDTIKNAVGTVGNSSRLGKNVKAAGGFFPFVGGGISNAFGGQKRDSKTVASYDKLISDAETGIGNINKSAELREKLNSAVTDQFDQKYGSLESRLSNDKQYQELLWHQKNPDPSAPKSFENDMETQKLVDEMRQKIENQYNSERDTYFDSQIQAATSGNNNLDDDTRIIKRSLDEYNSFNAESGLQNRAIKDHNDMNRLKSVDERDTDKFVEQSRKAKQDKKAYQSSPEVVARQQNAEYRNNGSNKKK